MADMIGDLLRASLSEQTRVVLWLSHGRLEGVVARVDDDQVELRHERGRSAVRRDRIEAVTTE